MGGEARWTNTGKVPRPSQTPRCPTPASRGISNHPRRGHLHGLPDEGLCRASPRLPFVPQRLWTGAESAPTSAGGWGGNAEGPRAVLSLRGGGRDRKPRNPRGLIQAVTAPPQPPRPPAGGPPPVPPAHLSPGACRDPGEHPPSPVVPREPREEGGLLILSSPEGPAPFLFPPAPKPCSLGAGWVLPWPPGPHRPAPWGTAPRQVEVCGLSAPATPCPQLLRVPVSPSPAASPGELSGVRSTCPIGFTLSLWRTGGAHGSPSPRLPCGHSLRVGGAQAWPQACVDPFPPHQQEPPHPSFPLRLEGGLDVSPSANGQTRNVVGTELNMIQDGKWRLCDIQLRGGNPLLSPPQCGGTDPQDAASLAGGWEGTRLGVVGLPPGQWPETHQPAPEQHPHQVPRVPEARREPSSGLKLGLLCMSWCHGHCSRTYPP
ncbi:basic proline-rich protein-like [Neofelis nebulosa]|uniref:basic proline-rich protein-like n=1 Tax=Neofelis nebulosa TaxID=61452 RepID=UPI00272D6555|nr:basic proline-rich protein-like [Neofelis nebulosa]